MLVPPLLISKSIAACLFDMDGVLTDTASVHQAAWAEMFNAFLQHSGNTDGITAMPFTSDDYRLYVDGRLREDGVRTFLASRGIALPEGSADDPPDADTIHGLATRKNDLVRTILKRDDVTVISGSVTFLDTVRAAGLHTAVVSASRNTVAVLEAVGLVDRFDARIDGNTAAEHHLRGKPAPDTYLAAAQALYIPPIHCAVFEDAKAGIIAGRAGHFGLVVGIDRSGRNSASLHEGGADLIVGDLSELLEEQ